MANPEGQRALSNVTNNISAGIAATMCDQIIIKLPNKNIYIHISPADEAERRREERNQQQRKRRNEMTNEQREEMNRKRREQRAMKKVQPDNLND